MKKQTILLLVAVAIIIAGVGVYFLIRSPSDKADLTQGQKNQAPVGAVQPRAEVSATPTPEPEQKGETVFGKSVQNRDIIAYHYGGGDKEIIFVGGMHGGYSWNTVLVAYELMDYLKSNPAVIPANLKVTVIPVFNPDGLNKIVGTTGRFTKTDVPTSKDLVVSGRFNANGIDLNRNFDCDWQEAGFWQKTAVNGGSEVFSEPESKAFKDYIETRSPAAVVVWYSAAGGVFASNCHNGILPETLTIMNIFSKASGYPAYNSFDFYKLTGDMVNWLAKQKIPAFSVLLTTHEDTEWSKNRAGIDALLEHYAE